MEPTSSEDNVGNKLSELHRSHCVTFTRVTTTRTSSEKVKSDRPSSPSSEDEDEDKIRVIKEVFIVRDVEQKIPECDDENEDEEERITDKELHKLTGVDVIKSVEPTSSGDDNISSLFELDLKYITANKSSHIGIPASDINGG